MTYRFTAVFTHDPKSNTYAAWLVELPGAISQGATIEEAQHNLGEAARLLIESYRDEARQAIAENEADSAMVTQQVIHFSC